MSDPFHDAVDQLREAGIENPRREASWLLKKAVGVPEDQTVLPSDLKPTPSQVELFKTLIARRATREPLQHIFGDIDFMGLEFKTDARALIPRWDSKAVAKLAMNCLPGTPGSMVADLGTGSGILLAVLLNTDTSLTGIAIERSAEALSLAKENFVTLGLYRRVICFQGSWADWTGWAECDLIVSNPPYIRSEIIATLQPEVRDYDPVEALDGGPDGLNAYREIISLAAQHMKPGAHLVLEIGFDQKQAVTELLEQARFIDMQHQQDIGGNDRAIAARKP